MRTALALILLSGTLFAQTVNLPSSKTLEPVPGSPLKLNSFPSNIVISPDGRYAAILNQGYGTESSGMYQSIAIYDIQKRTLRDFPDARLPETAKQTYWLGLAFSSKGNELYASIASLTDPEGTKPGTTGNGIAVYSFADGEIKPARFLKIPLQQLAVGKKYVYGDTKVPDGKAIPFPAGLSVVPANAETPHDRILVANNLSDNAILLDAVTGETLKSFDLSTKDFVPAVFPHSTIVAPDGKRAWVSLWNTGMVAELDLQIGTVATKYELAAVPFGDQSDNSAHASSMLFAEQRDALIVALSNRNDVKLLDLKTGRAQSVYVAMAPINQGGAMPTGLALFGRDKLLVAMSGLNGIALVSLDAVEELRAENLKLDQDPTRAKVGKRVPTASAFFPTQWYPTAIAVHDDDVLIVNAKGVGTGPNSGRPGAEKRKSFPYIASRPSTSRARCR